MVGVWCLAPRFGVLRVAACVGAVAAVLVIAIAAMAAAIRPRGARRVADMGLLLAWCGWVTAGGRRAHRRWPRVGGAEFGCGPRDGAVVRGRVAVRSSMRGS